MRDAGETWGDIGIGAVAVRGDQRVAERSLARRGRSSMTAELLAIGQGLTLAEVAWGPGYQFDAEEVQILHRSAEIIHL